MNFDPSSQKWAVMRDIFTKSEVFSFSSALVGVKAMDGQNGWTASLVQQQPTDLYVRCATTSR